LASGQPLPGASSFGSNLRRQHFAFLSTIPINSGGAPDVQIIAVIDAQSVALSRGHTRETLLDPFDYWAKIETFL
jgi:hypothetical protein